VVSEVALGQWQGLSGRRIRCTKVQGFNTTSPGQYADTGLSHTPEDEISSRVSCMKRMLCSGDRSEEIPQMEADLFYFLACSVPASCVSRPPKPHGFVYYMEADAGRGEPLLSHYITSPRV
jgi:hypothetical protein